MPVIVIRVIGGILVALTLATSGIANINTYNKHIQQKNNQVNENEESVTEILDKAGIKIPLESMLGQWLTDEDCKEILKEYGNIPVIVKGGSGRGLFPIEEVIENGKEFENVHPNIGFIREVWIPSKSNLKEIKKNYPKEYEWYKHIKF